MRLKFSKQLDKDNERNKTTVDIIKNKCGSPWGKAEFKINWSEGIDKMQEIIEAAVEFKLLTKGGAWYTLENGAKIQGDDGMKQFLRDNEEFAQQLEKQTIEKIKAAQV